MTMEWRGDEHLRRLAQARVRGLRKGGEFVVSQTNPTVPFRDGDLMRSGHVLTEAEDTVLIVYDQPYARVQHENLGFHHAPGRHAKYLEIGINQHGETALMLAARELRSAF